MVNTLRAYEKARNARESLEEAAEDLGYDSVHELADAAANNDLPEDVRDTGVEGITNAHSFLNNGSIESLDERW